MEFENLLTLIKTVSDSELTDFDYKNGTCPTARKKRRLWFLAHNFKCTGYGTLFFSTMQPLGQITESEAKMGKILQMVNQRVCL